VLKSICLLVQLVSALASPVDDPALLGVPVDHVLQTPVAALSVRSSVEGVGPADLVDGGSVEMWSDCYATGDDGSYDANDVRTNTDCYGSLQVHLDGVPVLALNRWSNAAGALDLGIGPSPGLHPDWTFSGTAGAYDARRLEVHIRRGGGD
jgi:hypothetical protein